jgi:hypothetical protein
MGDRDKNLEILTLRHQITDLSPQTLNYVAGVIPRHRKSMRSVWRRLNPSQQASLMLVYLP